MKKYSEMTREELTAEKERLQARYDKYMKQDLSLNMARGKPSIEQEEASIEMLDIINSRSNLETEEKQDVLNYGNLMGLIEARRLFSEILGVPVEKIVIGGNSSLNMMFDYLMQCYAMGSGKHTNPGSSRAAANSCARLPAMTAISASLNTSVSNSSRSR